MMVANSSIVAPVYEHVRDPDFHTWAQNNLEGSYELFRTHIKFSHEQDLILYELSWHSTKTHVLGVPAGFYCPYVPLTSSGVSVNPDTMDSVATFITR